MQKYKFSKKFTGEIAMQKFKSLKQVEDFLQTNKQLEIIEEELQNLPIRRTRQIS